MGLSVLVLHGDAEAELFAQAETTLLACFPAAELAVKSAWTTRSDLFRNTPAGPPGQEPTGAANVAELLGEHHDLVLLSTLADVALPLMRGPRGPFVAHRGVAATWSAEQRASIEAESKLEGLIDLDAAVRALEGVIEDLQGRGQAVALCTVFRHVVEPLQHRALPDTVSLRRRIAVMNLQVAKLSQRTGCFVVDLNRVLADEGGTALQADCFGGGERAQELALEELVSVVLEALPQVAGEEG